MYALGEETGVPLHATLYEGPREAFVSMRPRTNREGGTYTRMLRSFVRGVTSIVAFASRLSCGLGEAGKRSSR